MRQLRQKIFISTAALGVLVLSNCVTTYSHDLLKSYDPNLKVRDSQISVTSDASGSGKKSYPPWALRFTIIDFDPRSTVVIEKIRIASGKKSWTFNPRLVIQPSSSGWGQSLTDFLIEEQMVKGDVTVIYEAKWMRGARAERISQKLVFRREDQNGIATFNPILDIS